ncbi:hypothetical protein PF001_g30857 [Phytophthora fragariae]|uniref:Reverse transcriptase RNase H-like domain-containing protein n=1 Tax=Phytophthora fragariae TaxID=53985 RepID=A0A6A3DCB5_9STRA|nr:hypothetical protein PF009_g30457 [Phytophthora fragariae]KAE9064409.1 hypothetical protein PF006_g30703 [Phytophthora fragariae]KAE9265510.1 hypothetical protein PF001_g30857 [Phytophthora fragariae]
MLPDDSKPVHVVCDASDFAIGCALMQFDDEGRERVVSYQSRQMKRAERNYPVHELLAMRYALIKFRVYLLGEQTFAVYTDHASLRTAMKSTHLSQRMARWLSFFTEYNFVVHYKPGKNNILADAPSRRPDYDPRTVLGRQVINDEDEDDDHWAVCIASGINLTNVSPEMDLRDEIVAAYADDAVYAGIVAYLRAPSDETLGLCRATRATRSTATTLTVICCATTSTSSMLLESPCPTTTTCGFGSSTSFMTAPWVRIWAARRHSRLFHATSSGPTCTSGCASGSALARTVSE